MHPSISLLMLACAADPTPTDSAVTSTTSTTPATSTSGPQTVPWSFTQPRITAITAPDGWSWARSIIHLHSPWSHDACDGQGYKEGVLNEDCLARLRGALCDAGVDIAWMTDHPSHAAEPEFEDLLLARDADTLVSQDGQPVGFEVACDDGTTTLWRPGHEDELMPVGLERHVTGTAEERDALLNRSDAEALGQMQAAGGLVLQAHTEGRDQDTLDARQADGLAGVEIFNLHAMVDPAKRSEDLGLHPTDWLLDAALFMEEGSLLEPDLVFLTFYEEQSVSIERWDTLLAQSATIGVAGTDAHENSLPTLMADGDRMDSYRRMMRWFSNWVLLPDDPMDRSPQTADAALAAGRSAVVFDVLGLPEGLDFSLTADGTRYEMGQTAPGGTLGVGCVTLSALSPQSLEQPEITTRVMKDGAVWAEDCGELETDGPGVYRVEIDILPNHLRDFIGETGAHLIETESWVYTNPIRVE